MLYDIILHHISLGVPEAPQELPDANANTTTNTNNDKLTTTTTNNDSNNDK